MEQLPREILFQILLEVNRVEDVLKLCSIVRSINVICNDDYFWKKRFEKIYSNLKLPLVDNYKELYKAFYTSGIAKSLKFPPVIGRKYIGMIKPEPPYAIAERTILRLTEIGGSVRYIIQPDISFTKVTKNPDNWIMCTYPRDSSTEERLQIEIPTLTNIIDLNEVQNQINRLTSEGFYQLGSPFLDKNTVYQYQNNGYILRINSITYTPTTDGCLRS